VVEHVNAVVVVAAVAADKEGPAAAVDLCRDAAVAPCGDTTVNVRTPRRWRLAVAAAVAAAGERDAASAVVTAIVSAANSAVTVWLTPGRAGVAAAVGP
jgi:hypothetical protein